MTVEKITLDAFAVIGKLGSTEDGSGFIQSLWADANAHFPEISHLVLKNEQSAPIGIWGAMSDMSLSFRPWEEGFTKGLYLAGAECRMDADAPEGWVKWVIPAYEYLRVENEGPDTVSRMLQYLDYTGQTLAGAVHDFTDPATVKGYMYFPIRRV